MRYTIRHTLNTDVDTFWDKIFFNTDYNEALFKRLHFTLYKEHVLDRKPDGSITRRTECVPALEIPAIAKKFFGDSAGYFEEGTFDPKTRRFVSEVHPKVGGDKIQMRVALWVEPAGDKRIDRVVDVESNVKIFAVGKVVEALIEKNTRESYDLAASFTNKWIAEKAM